jgi:hypothetical protein
MISVLHCEDPSLAASAAEEDELSRTGDGLSGNESGLQGVGAHELDFGARGRVPF